MKGVRYLTILLALLLLLVAGCGTSTSAVSGTPAAKPARSLACKGLTTIQNALGSLSNVGQKTTVGQVQTVQSHIGTALSGLDKIIPGSASTALNQLKTANTQLGQTLANLPANDTLGQHAAQLQQVQNELGQAQTTTTTLATKLNCST